MQYQSLQKHLKSSKILAYARQRIYISLQHNKKLNRDTCNIKTNEPSIQTEWSSNKKIYYLRLKISDMNFYKILYKSTSFISGLREYLQLKNIPHTT